MSQHPRDPKPTSTLSIEDGRGEEVLSSNPEGENQVVLATDSQGNSLTLLEEYARRKNSGVPLLEFLLSCICATASLAFAALIYINSH